MLATRMRMAAAGVTGTPTADWWLVAGKTCVAAYQPIGAASLAASYVNLANPGTYDAAPGTAPTWASGTGWTFNGVNQYLTTGINPNAQTWSYLVRFSDCALIGTYQYIFGRIGTGCTIGFGAVETSGNLSYYNGGGLVKATPIASGVLGIAGTTAYRNGMAESGTIGAYSGTTANALWLGAINALNFTNVPAHNQQAVAIYSDVLSGAEVATLSAAMAALT